MVLGINAEKESCLAFVTKIAGNVVVSLLLVEQEKD
jgi:hypothetical protein